MTRLFIFLFLVCAVGCHQTPHQGTAVAPDPELRRLTAALDAADTQTDMNLASKQIADFWDAKLGILEKQISQKLDGEERKRFSDSKERWHSYRAQEVRFRSSFFDGGSIQPLMANMSYSEITEHRVDEMESFFADALKGRQ